VVCTCHALPPPFGQVVPSRMAPGGLRRLLPGLAALLGLPTGAAPTAIRARGSCPVPPRSPIAWWVTRGLWGILRMRWGRGPEGHFSLVPKDGGGASPNMREMLGTVPPKFFWE